MPRNTIQMWPKICSSSLQLSEELSTKRWNTCSSAITTITPNTAATSHSAARSMASNTRCIVGVSERWAAPSELAPPRGAASKASVGASSLLADLRQQRLGAELLGQFVLRGHGGLLQRRDVDVV